MASKTLSVGKQINQILYIMKKVFTLALLSLAMMMSCSNEFDEQSIQAQQEFSKFYASMEGATSRTYVDEDYQLYWTADDRVTIFDGNTYPLQYMFMGETGDNHGEFEAVHPAGYHTGSPLNANYAVYPYNENASVTYDGKISYTIPATQLYAENSFGLGANTMVAVTNGVEDKFLEFKNVGGCFEFPLYGENVKVKSIVLSGNNGEKLAGAAVITAAYGEEPTMTFGDDATTSLTLDCGEEGVLLSNDAENPTKFWIVVPAITFERGFTLTITDTNGIVTTKSVGAPISIGRSKVQPFANALQLRTIQNNEIWYTSIEEGAKFDPYNQGAFGDGVTMISNVYIEDIGYWVITFTNDVKQIGYQAFYGSKQKQRSIILPNSVTEIGESAFSNNQLYSINIPDGVTSIGNNAFSSCSHLQSINIPDGVTSIGNSAFYHCEAVQSITIPESVESIGTGVFRDCYALSIVTILSDKITTLADQVFLGCKMLSSFNIPNSVTTIGASAFKDCDALISITIPDGVTSIGEGAFGYCDALTSINIPNGITSIANDMFNGCSLSNIEIPNSVETIGDWAFYGCPFVEITIPESVTSIGNAAFWRCRNLSAVYCKPTTPPTLGSDNVFNDNAGERKFYVPNNADVVKAYKAAERWSSHADSIEADVF